jgi:hypothetical protein
VEVNWMDGFDEKGRPLLVSDRPVSQGESYDAWDCCNEIERVLRRSAISDNAVTRTSGSSRR